MALILFYLVQIIFTWFSTFYWDFILKLNILTDISVKKKIKRRAIIVDNGITFQV